MKWLDLRVGGTRWAVYLVAANSKYLRDDDGDQVKGQTHFDECRIYITNAASEPARDELLLHELLHAVFHGTGASHSIGDGDKEEAIVRDLTPTLHRLLVDLGFRFPKGMSQ